MMFDLTGFGAKLPNTSSGFDYYEINKARLSTATQVKQETQSRPAAVGHEAVDPFIALAHGPVKRRASQCLPWQAAQILRW